MKIKYFVFTLFFAFSSTVFSQINLGLSAGNISTSGDQFLSNTNDFLGKYWESGFALNFTGEYFLTSSLAISPTVEFATYKFDHYSFGGGISIPEDYVKNVTGKNSNQLNLFVSLKYLPPTKSIFQFVLITGVGYMYENLGVINATVGNINFGEKNVEIKLDSKNKFVHLLGLGVRLKLLSQISLSINGSYYSDYSDRFYPTMKLGFIYHLTN